MKSSVSQGPALGELPGLDGSPGSVLASEVPWYSEASLPDTQNKLLAYSGDLPWPAGPCLSKELKF